MNIWVNAPIFRLFLFYCLGIVCYRTFPEHGSFILLGIAWVIFLAAYFKFRSTNRYAIFVLVGFSISSFLDKPLPELQSTDYEVHGIATLLESPKSGEFHTKAKCYLKLTGSDLPIKTILSSDSSLQKWQRGDILFVKGQFQNINGPGNPGDFNYASYLREKGIRQVFKLKLPAHYQGSKAGKLALFSRFQKDLASSLPLSSGSKELVSALVLGYKAELSDELINGFRGSGIMHVLAVSGLHVGLVLLLLNKLSNIFLAHPRWKWLRFLILLTGVWSFALLTGASNSVVRAAIMCSFVALAMVLRSTGSGLNYLGLSGLIILSLDPTALFSAGFQLSFCAVGGLMIYQPVHKEFRKGLLHKLKGTASGSITAQLWTSPLVLHYFGQLPSYFLAGNLILLPIATLLLYLGIALLIFRSIPYLSNILIIAVELLSKLVISGSIYISALPFSIVKFEIKDPLIVLLLFVFFIALRQAYYSKSVRPLLFFLGFWAMQSWVSYLNSAPSNLSTIFGRQGFKIASVDEYSFRQEITFGDSLSANSPTSRSFRSDDAVLNFYGGTHRTMSVHQWKEKYSGDSFDVDVLMLSGPYPSPENLKSLMQTFKPRLVIIHQGYYPSLRKKWKRLLEDAEVPVFSLSDSYIRITSDAS